VAAWGTVEAADSMLAALVDQVRDALGPIDVLVANAGLAKPAEWEQVDAADYDRTMAGNLRAPFLLAKAALPAMRQRGFGRVLFVSSTAAIEAACTRAATRRRRRQSLAWASRTRRAISTSGSWRSIAALRMRV